MGNQSKDPVCGMKIDAEHCEHKASFQGKQYGFCCQKCKNAFEKNPKQFTKE